ncbi:MAG: helix-turn-helix domain-containing protein [Streptomycetales bacterium]
MSQHVSTSGRGWAYAGVLLGGGVSIAANIAHSYVPPDEAGPKWSPEHGAVIGAVFWPIALFIAIEILARTRWPELARWVVLRYLGLLPVAVVAAVVSYRHLSGLLEFYNEDALTATIGPLAVDGLMAISTAALLATGPRYTQDTHPDLHPVPDTVAPRWADTTPATTPDIVPDTVPDTWAATVPATTPDTVPRAAADSRPDGDPARQRPRPRRTGGRRDNAAAVARLRERHPDMTTTQIARRLGVSDRTVRRLANT